MNQAVENFKKNAENALKKGMLVAVKKAENIQSFERKESHVQGSLPPYHINMTHLYHFYDKENPLEMLFQLHVPYLLEISLECDLQDICEEEGISEYSRNILEVSSGLVLSDSQGVKIDIGCNWDKPDNVIDWHDLSFYHQMCHDSIFADEDTQEGYEPFIFKIGPSVDTAQKLHKLEFEDCIHLDLECVAMDLLHTS